MRFNRAVMIMMLCVSCRPGVHSLSDPEIPLARLSLTLSDELKSELNAADAPLRLGLLWAKKPPDIANCATPFDLFVQQIGCPEALRFMPGLVDVSVPFDRAWLDQNEFAFDLPHLPNGVLLEKQADGTIGYGTIVLFADTNNNERLDVIDSTLRPNVSTDCELEHAECIAIDSVYGATFWRAGASAQQRLVLREGEFSEDSTFLPLDGCETPPVGLSIARSSAASMCTVDDLEEPMRLEQPDAASRDSLLCTMTKTVSTEPRGEPSNDALVQCIDSETLVYVYPFALCKQLFTVTLRGCYNSDTCVVPDWDYRDIPPRWWPCTGIANSLTAQRTDGQP